MVDSQEQWRPITGGNYEISSHGRFRRSTPGRKTEAGKLLTLTKLKIGYHVVQPVINGKNVMKYIHHLVAEAFIGPRPDGFDINHRDGVKTNNRVDNLEYVTHAENMRHAADNGMIGGKRVIPDETIETMRSLRSRGLSYSQVARETGVSIGYCWMVINKRNRR